MKNNNPYFENGAAAIKPDPNIDFCEWANEHFMLPRESTSEYGKYRTSRTPQVEDILRALSPNCETEKVVVIKPTQNAGTTIALIFMCATADLYPGPLLLWQPTDTMVRSFSTKKLSKIIKLIPALNEKIKDKVKDSSNTILMKTFPGGSFMLSGANSEASYRSESVRYAIIDDFNGFPLNIQGQGAPSTLIDRRTGTFANRKIYINSTTTTKNSNIEKEFETSSQGYYHTPCPHCGHYQYLTWGSKDGFGIKYTTNDDNIVIDAWYQCECCKKRIEETEKQWMFENYKYVHKFPDRKVKGFKYNGLHTPLGWINSWAYIAQEFIHAINDLRKGNSEKYITWLNTLMCEPYEQKGDRKTEDIIKLKDARMSGNVPSDGVLGLVAGIDTQKNGFWYVIRAYGANLESWLIRYGFVDTFEALENIMLNSEYLDAKGKAYKVLFALQDAMGHRTVEVYDFCRVRPAIMCAQGVQKMAALYTLSNIDTYPGTTKPIPGGVKLLRVNTTLWKNNLATKILVNPADPGAFHVHSETMGDYFSQMTAEFIDEKGVWECPNGKPNHLWDCETLALTAANYIGVHHFKPANAKTKKQIVEKKKKWIEPGTGHVKKGWMSR